MLRRLEDARGTAGAEGAVWLCGRTGVPFAGGVDDARSKGVGCVPSLLGSMFPLAELSLFVNDEMAQPIHWLLG